MSANNSDLLTHTQLKEKKSQYHSSDTASEYAQILGSLEKHFQSVIINEPKELKQNMTLRSEQILNLSSEIETILKSNWESIAEKNCNWNENFTRWAQWQI